MNKLINFLPILIIRLYQATKKRKYSKCLFYPSCSNYGILAFKKYHFFKALRITVRRLKDCNFYSDRSFIDYP